MTKYLVFIPAYNVESSIEEVIDTIRRAQWGVDILVIDDGSTDGTGRLLNHMEGIFVLQNDKNKGYGATLIKGFEFAISHNYDYLITLDGDKQHQPYEIARFIRENKNQPVDILSGSRYLEASDNDLTQAPAERMKVNKRITSYINSITGYNLTDAFCGFKLYRVEALRKLHLSEPGYGMPLQLLLEAWKKELSIREVPVKMIYFDRERRIVHQKLYGRYRYYLEIIKNETETYETTDISRAPR
ncbi:MAG: glycosyltransferase family 2 protein [Bacteroidales bacterium]|nr:glycosyltransferase family 2 protein [Bacteroidales bacterium]